MDIDDSHPPHIDQTRHLGESTQVGGSNQAGPTGAEYSQVTVPQTALPEIGWKIPSDIPSGYSGILESPATRK